MNSNLEYFHYFLLSLFNQKTPSKASQLIHVLQGRRTPSMLFKVEQEKLYSAFGLFKSLTKDQLNQYLKTLTVKKLINGSDKEGYRLSLNGKTALNQFFTEKTYPSKVESLETATLRTPFFYQFQLVAQIFSEVTYHNKYYSPAIKDPTQQVAVKEWFASLQEPMNDLSEQWAKELVILLETLSEMDAVILVGKLTGHDLIGQTNRQLADKLSLDSIELYILLDQAIEQLIHAIENSDCVLFKSFLKQIRKTHYYGLSKSTYFTALCIQNDQTIEEIAFKRNLKLNTIREHILEIALVQKSFDFKPFIPDDIYSTLHQFFEKNPELSYQQAKRENENLQFMWYRLVEIERIRYDSNKD